MTAARGCILLDWLQIIPEEIANRWQSFPFLGRSPPFDWSQLEAKLKEHPELADVQIFASAASWRNPAEGLPASCARADIGLSGLSGTLQCLLPQEHIDQLLHLMLGDQPLDNSALRNAFLRYCVISALHFVGPIAPLNAFALTLASVDLEKSAPEDLAPALCIDLTIQKGEQTLLARLVLDAPFVTSWKDHWRGKAPMEIDASAAESTNLTLQLLAGQVALLPEDVQSLKVGDWVCLDAHGFSEVANQASVSLRVANIEIGKGTIQGAELKLQECLSSPFTIRPNDRSDD